MSARDLISFVSSSPTAFHAVAEMKKRLSAAGFLELCENSKWNISHGGKYFVTRGGSALIAFRVPEAEFSAFQIVASHCDSPGFKLKSNFALKVGNNYTKLSVEKYGGPIISTWFDRPLSIAGRLMVKDGSTVRQVLVDVGRALAVIPNMPPHLDRSSADGAKYDLKKDVFPLLEQGTQSDRLISILESAAGVKKGSIVSHELFLYPLVQGTLYGVDDEFLAAPRLDDLECVYASLRGILECRNSKNMPVHCVFNNEEIGSATREGADSDFLKIVLDRICDNLGCDFEEKSTMLAGSIMLSADNAHALHPNHTELFDEENCPVINKGIVIKHSAAKKYMTDAVTHAVVRQLCEFSQVPYQIYHNRADIPGGSTLGCIAVSNVSVRMVDIGLSQLAMHSTLETAGTKDLDYMLRLLKEFYSVTIRLSDDEFSIEL